MNLEVYFEIVLEAGWETFEFYNNDEVCDLVLLVEADDACGLHPMGYGCTNAKACEDAFEKLSLEDRTKLRECEGGAVISRVQGDFQFELFHTFQAASDELSRQQHAHNLFRTP